MKMNGFIDESRPARGYFRVVRVDGTGELIKGVSIDAIHRAIGCESVDTVTLDHARARRLVMLVDDTGKIDGKPVNEAATMLVKAAKGASYPNKIHGDVAIANDQDFA